MEPSQGFSAHFALRLGRDRIEVRSLDCITGKARGSLSLRHVPAPVWLLSVLRFVCFTRCVFVFGRLPCWRLAGMENLATRSHPVYIALRSCFVFFTDQLVFLSAPPS